MILALVTVLVEMSAARGIVAFLANVGVIGLSTYSTNLLTLLVIAAGTDYVIFLLGRYHERRNEGMDREAAFYDMYRGTSHVILGSGLTIAGAVACLYFTRLPYFQSLGIPAAIGVLVALIASLTLSPAVIVIGSRFGLLEPKRKTAKWGWRRIGTAIVRWPGPILIATLALAFVGLAALSGYKVSYDISRYMPDSAAVQCGVRRRGAALLEGAAESRTADDRHRSRSSQSHRHDPAGAGRQGRLPHRRHRAGAVDHAAAGYAAGPHVDPVPDQREQRSADQQPALPAGPGRRPSQAGRASSTTRSTSCGSSIPCSSSPATSRTSRARHSNRPSPSHRTCATRSPTSTISSARCATTSTGSHTVSTSRCAPRCGRSSMRSTGSTR